MANSIFIPVLRFPLNLPEVQELISPAFADLGLESPKIAFHPDPPGLGSVSESIIVIDGNTPDFYCWITFGEYPVELTGSGATGKMVSITTRGSWLFAAIVGVGILDLGGELIFNDSCELDGREQYAAKEFKELVRKSFRAGQFYIKD